LQVSAYQNLVEKVLNELLLQRSRSEKAVKVGSKQLGDEVAAEGQDEFVHFDLLIQRTYPRGGR